MIPKKAGRRWMPGQVMWVSMGVAALIWAVDAVVFDVLILREGTYIQQLFSPEPVDLWMRSLAMGLVLASGVFGQREVNTHRRQRERYQALLHLGGSVGEAIIVLQDNERGEAIQVFVSDEWPRMTGYSDDELRGMSFFDLVRLEDRDDAGQRHRRKMDGEAMPGLFEMTVIRKDGSEFPIELTSAHSDYGGERANVAFIRDITERKQARELFEAALLSSPIGMYIVQDGEFRFVNPQFQANTGYGESELLATDPLSIVVPEDRGRVKENAISMLKGKRSQPYEYRTVAKTGEVRWALETVASIQYQGRRATLGNYMDITERKQAEEKMERYHVQLERLVEERTGALELAEQRATTDGLTGLFNHRYFHERFDEEIARCSRFGDVCSLIVLDVDHFKSYNDAYGHPAGDEVLRQFGRIIDQCTRDVDLGFRYGGDEFAVLLTGTGLEGASRLAERIRKAVGARTGQLGTRQSCSVGVASWPTDGVLREDIIQAADAALYHAKQTGKNRVCLASETALADVLRTGASSDGQSGSSVLSIIYALAATVDAKDPLTHGHCQKVGKWATDVAEALGRSTEEVDRIRTAALLHDIGKIGMPDRLLTTCEPLVEGDWKQIHAHPDIGVAILKHVDSLKGCLAGIRHHHERYDGSGYPAGLQGANIPLDARILAVADSYDAMTSRRPYRRRKATKKQALVELRRGGGTQFDPMVVEVFTKLVTGSPAAARESEAAPVATLTTG